MAEYRYILTRAATGEVLHWNLPLTEVEFGPERSGPGSFHATLNPTFRRALSDMLDDAGELHLDIDPEGQMTLKAQDAVSVKASWLSLDGVSCRAD